MQFAKNEKQRFIWEEQEQRDRTAGKRQRIAEQNADILTKRRQIGSLTSLRANAKAQVLADLDAVILERIADLEELQDELQEMLDEYNDELNIGDIPDPPTQPIG